MSELEQHVVVDTGDGLCTVELNRPGKKNALTAAMYSTLANTIAEANDDPATRVLFLTARGDSFCAGNDVVDFAQNPPRDSDAPVLRFLRTLTEFEKPLVVAVRGVAVGVGTTMLMHCDLVYAASSARFSAPFVPLGLVPEAASSLLLPRAAGYARANEILLLGEPFDAIEARDIGLVTRVLPDDELSSFGRAQCAKLVELPAAALRATKALIRAPQKDQVRAAIDKEAAVFLKRLGSPEAAEAFRAFANKRKPDFSQFS